MYLYELHHHIPYKLPNSFITLTIMSSGSIYYTIEICSPPTYLPKAVSRMWPKQNIFHVGHKIHWCWCKCHKICPLSSVSLKSRSFTGKKYYGITIILLMYQSAMLYKYKQNITFYVINTQIHTKKKNPGRNKGRVTFPYGGSIFYIVF